MNPIFYVGEMIPNNTPYFLYIFSCVMYQIAAKQKFERQSYFNLVSFGP